MSKYCGDDGVVAIITDSDDLTGTADTPATLTQVTSFDVEERAAIIPTTAKGDAAETNKPGRTSWSGTISVMYDSALAPHADIEAGDELDCLFYFEGNASGKQSLAGLAHVESVQRTSPEGDSLYTATARIVGNGAITKATVA